MTFADVEAKTTFMTVGKEVNPETGEVLNGGKPADFSPADRAIIIGAMQEAYDGSPTAKAIFDNYIAVPGNVITFGAAPGELAVPDKFNEGGGVKFNEGGGGGYIQLDLAQLKDAYYVTPTGKKAPDTPLSAIVHELGHALGGYSDKKGSPDGGYNVEFVNKIFDDLHIPEQRSYEDYHKVGYHDSPLEDAGTAGGDTPPPEAPPPQTPQGQAVPPPAADNPPEGWGMNPPEGWGIAMALNNPGGHCGASASFGHRAGDGPRHWMVDRLPPGGKLHR